MDRSDSQMQRGFGDRRTDRQIDEQMDIGDCRVAFTTEKNDNKLLSTIVIIMTKIYSFVSKGSFQ